MRFGKLRYIVLQYLIPALVTLAIIRAGETWPQYKIWLWAGFWVLFVAGFGIYIWRVVDEPVNYKSIRILSGPFNYKSIDITSACIEYKVSIKHHIIPFKEITSVKYIREEALFEDLAGPYLETKWFVKTADGKYVEIMDEWPDRRKMLRAFIEYLPGFDRAAAIQGIRAKKEGQWPCFQRPTA